MKFDATKLRIKMAEKNVSLRDLAAELKISKATISGWRHGKTPSLKAWSKLNEYFDVDSYFFVSE
jgi:predicted transcriptional regulator